MQGLEKILYFVCLSFYAVSAVAAFSGFLTLRRYRVLYALIIATLGALIGVRWYHAGHPPIFGTYEETLSASFAVTVFSLILDREGRFGRFTATFAFFTLLYGSLFDSTLKPLVISEQSLWVEFHALFAWIAYGFYSLVFAAAISVLLKKEETLDVLSDWLMRKGLLYGFIGQTVFFVIGSYYSTRLHGRWWMWDAVEYLFVASWLIYAVAIHGRILSGWSNKRTALWIAAGFAAAIVLYWGLIYFPQSTYHVFDTEFKTHFP